MKSTLHIRLLGDFQFQLDDAPAIALAVPRAQSLLAYLLLHRNAPQSRAHLAFLLWPDSTEAQARTNLRKQLHQLRQAFPAIEQFLYTDNQSLQWLPNDEEHRFTLDLEQIEQALAQAKAAEQLQDWTNMRQALEQVVYLYRGDLVPGCYDEWLLPERELWRKLFISSAERLLALLEQEHEYDSAISVAQQLLYHDPLHEATYRQLMRLYVQQGNRAAALHAYHNCVTALERELGTGPSSITQELYESLMQSQTLSAPSTPLQKLTESRTVRDPQAPFIGRKVAWQQLQTLWRRVVTRHQQVVLLSGEAGIGKTRLAEELTAWVGRQDMLTLSARCYTAEGQLPYAPVTAWLRADAGQSTLSRLDTAWLTDIARLLPELLVQHPKLPRPGPMTEGWQRQHFFEALARAFLSVRQPFLLFRYDLQWCDGETLEWLHYLLRFQADTHLLLVATVRIEEITPEHALVAFLSTLQRDGMVTEIVLEPLDAAETASLALHMLGQQADQTLLDTIYAETEGNPLFVVEMARAQTHAQGEQVRAHNKGAFALLTQSASTLPARVQSVLMARLAQLSPLARSIANIAAVIGHEFTLPVLIHASRQSEDEVVQALDELWQRRIVREQETGAGDAYDFNHDKLREMAYHSQSSAQQRLLHRRVAEALEFIYGTNLDTVSLQIAFHYERANLPVKALPYYRRAGEAALRIHANTEAVTALQHAATLFTSTLNQGQREQYGEEAAAMYMTLGNIYSTTGRQVEAREAYQRGLAALPPQPSLWRARLLRKIASTWNLASDNPLDTFHSTASQVFQEAEGILEQVKDAANIQWQQEWIQLQIDQLLPLRGSMAEMTSIIERAQAAVDRYGTAEQRSQFFQAVAARDAIRDRFTASEETVMYCRKALAVVQQTGNMSLIGFAHFVLANRLWWSNHLDEAEQEMQQAIAIAECIGNTALLARSLTFLPFLFRQRGQSAEVQAVVTRGLTMPEASNTSIIKGHSAWLAWRRGDLAEAERIGRASIEAQQSQQRGNAFRWAGLWPLIGVALTQERFSDAIDWVRMLFEPAQQPPAREIGILLEAALQAWDAGKQEESSRLLLQVLPLAEQRGYL